jgi:hypothetical protein
VRAAALLLVLVARPGGAQEKAALTPNSFLARGKPTFVVGTAGDDASDRKVRAQVMAIRGMLFPDARVVEDTAIDVAKGPSAWPANPVLYGGPHVNRVLAELQADLPFSMSAGRLAVGGKEFVGGEYRLIAAVPAGKRHPDFLVYAGAGTPGVAEINAVTHGPRPFVIGDRFGPLVSGTWVRDEKGGLGARLAAAARRLPWRSTTRAGIKISRLELVPKRDLEGTIDATVRQAAKHAAAVLDLEGPVDLEIHIYPDRGSKRTLTGNAGDGHADVNSRTLHVLEIGGTPPRSLIIHEATHVLAYDSWGPAGTPLLAEGLAVWAAGSYGGRELDEWRRNPPARNVGVATLLGPDFRRLPERTTYPLAGILVEVLNAEVGLEPLRDHLYPSPPAEWPAACQRAGTTRDKIAKAFERALAGK